MTTLMKEQIQSQSPRDLSAVIDIDDWAGRVSLDIISKAGFGSDFHALSQPDTHLNTSYRAGFLPNANSQLLFVLSMLTHPAFINRLPTVNAKKLRASINAVTKWIRDFIAERQNATSEIKKTKGLHQDVISAAMESGAFDVENRMYKTRPEIHNVSRAEEPKSSGEELGS